MPLIRSTTISFLKKYKGKEALKQMIDKVYNPMTNIFGDEPDNLSRNENNILKKELLTISNNIAGQFTNPEFRDELLKDNDISFFETDLEALLDVFTLTYLRAEEFNNSLPLVAAVKVS